MAIGAPGIGGLQESGNWGRRDADTGKVFVYENTGDGWNPLGPEDGISGLDFGMNQDQIQLAELWSYLTMVIPLLWGHQLHGEVELDLGVTNLLSYDSETETWIVQKEIIKSKSLTGLDMQLLFLLMAHSLLPVQMSIIPTGNHDNGQIQVYASSGPSVEISSEASNGFVMLDEETDFGVIHQMVITMETDEFTISITDPQGGVSEQVISVTINPVDDPGIVSGDIFSNGDEDISTLGTLYGEDIDGLSSYPIFNISSAASYGNATIDGESGTGPIPRTVIIMEVINLLLLLQMI